MYFYDNSVDAHDWQVDRFPPSFRRSLHRVLIQSLLPANRNLFYMNSSITRHGRGLVHGRIYKRDGTLAGA